MLIDGAVSVGEVNERFGLRLPVEEFDTLGGYVFGTLGRVPVVGDTVSRDGARFEVASTDGPGSWRWTSRSRRRARRPARGGERARAASSSLFRAIPMSAGVIPPSLWVTQRSVTVSHAIETSGWWSAAFAASATRFTKAIEPLKSPHQNDF